MWPSNYLTLHHRGSVGRQFNVFRKQWSRKGLLVLEAYLSLYIFFLFFLCSNNSANLVYSRAYVPIIFEKRKRQKTLFKETMSPANRPFSNTAAMHIELIGFKEYYGMPTGHKDDPLYSHQYLRSLSGQLFFKFFFSLSSFSRKRLKWKKKIVVPSLNVITNVFFPRNIHWTSLFAGKERENTERVPPWASHNTP